MKKYLAQNKDIILLLVLIFSFWRISLFIPYIISSNQLLRNPSYMGFNPWTNMDGQHYLSIAEHNYLTYEQAFFPLFPLVIHYLVVIFHFTYVNTGLFFVHLSLLIALFVFWKLLLLDFDRKTAFWTIFFLLAFPTSFFLGSVYTESSFLLLIFSSFYFARKKRFWLSGFLGLIASATRLTGIFLMVSLAFEIYQANKKKQLSVINQLYSYFPVLIITFGLGLFMIYLWHTYNDPLYFIHAQAAFAQRTSGKIILLPQVLWRYTKIIFTFSFTQLSYWVAIGELVSFLFSVLSIYVAYIQKIRTSYILFCICEIILPTLSGTLLSFPRFLLTIFVIFIVLANIKNKNARYFIFSAFILLQYILTALYLQGYFIA